MNIKTPFWVPFAIFSCSWRLLRRKLLVELSCRIVLSEHDVWPTFRIRITMKSTATS